VNIQTIPRKDKVVKAAFIPKLDGFLLADYPNIELKLLAFYLQMIGDPTMAELFRQGADLHTATACGVLGLTLDWVKYPDYGISDESRQVGKVLNFSIVYGGGMPTIMEQLHIGPKEALEILTNYHATWPKMGWATKRNPAAEGTLLWAIDSQIKERALTAPDHRGYITTLYGRHLHPKAMHAALNNLCQGCAADLMKWAMIRVHQGLKEGGFESHIVNMVHDELKLDVRRDEVPALNILLPQWMTDPRIEAVVPILPECEISWTTWADKVKYKEAA
jgi:DNA polymerase-1